MKFMKPAVYSGLIKPNRKRALFSSISAWILILPSLILLYMIVWQPMILGTKYSFYKMQGYTPQHFVGLNNYVRVIQDTQFLRTLGNTFSYVFWSLVIGFIPPVLFAIITNELIHLSKFIKTSIYMPCIIPTIAVTMIWFYMYYPNEGGLLNMLLSAFGVAPQPWLQDASKVIPLIIITMTWHHFGSTTITYIACLQGVNQELYEAAIIDGAGILKRVRFITMPQIMPIILLNLVRQIIGIFQVFEMPFVMTGGGPNNASLSLALQSYRYAFVFGNTESALALSCITFIILLVITAFYFRLEKKLDRDV